MNIFMISFLTSIIYSLCDIKSDCYFVEEPSVDNCREISHDSKRGYCCYVELEDSDNHKNYVKHFCTHINQLSFLNINEFIEKQEFDIESLDCKSNYIVLGISLLLIIFYF